MNLSIINTYIIITVIIQLKHHFFPKKNEANKTFPGFLIHLWQHTRGFFLTCSSIIFPNSEKLDDFLSDTTTYHNIVQCQKIPFEANGKSLWKFKLLNY